MLEFLVYANIIILYIAGAALAVWAIKATGLGAWLANTWLGELTRPLWDIESNE